MNKNRLIAIIVCVVILLTVGFLYDKYRIAPKVNFENIEVTDLDGKVVKLQSFGNKKLFLNFFATWCGPCVREMRSLQDAQDKLQNENYVFVCISDEPTGLLKKFSDDRSIRLLILHSSKKMQSLNIFTYPTTYILNAKGEVRFKATGDRDWSTDENVEVIKENGN